MSANGLKALHALRNAYAVKIGTTKKGTKNGNAANKQWQNTNLRLQKELLGALHKYLPNYLKTGKIPEGPEGPDPTVRTMIQTYLSAEKQLKNVAQQVNLTNSKTAKATLSAAKFALKLQHQFIRSHAKKIADAKVAQALYLLEIRALRRLRNRNKSSHAVEKARLILVIKGITSKRNELSARIKALNIYSEKQKKAYAELRKALKLAEQQHASRRAKLESQHAKALANRNSANAETKRKAEEKLAALQAQANRNVAEARAATAAAELARNEATRNSAAAAARANAAGAAANRAGATAAEHQKAAEAAAAAQLAAQAAQAAAERARNAAKLEMEEAKAAANQAKSNAAGSAAARAAANRALKAAQTERNAARAATAAKQAEINASKSANAQLKIALRAAEHEKEELSKRVAAATAAEAEAARKAQMATIAAAWKGAARGAALLGTASNANFAELKNLVNKFKKSGHFTGNNANLQELINRVNKTNKNVTLNAFNTALKSWIKGHQTNIHTKTKNVTNPFTAWNLGAQALGKKGRPMYGRSSNPLYNVQNNLINKEHTIYKLYKGGELKNNVGLTAYKAYLRSLAAYKNAKAANNAAKAAAPARPRPAPVPSASQIISKLKLGTKSGFRWKSQNSLIQGKNGKYYVSPATGYVYVKHNGEYYPVVGNKNSNSVYPVNTKTPLRRQLGEPRGYSSKNLP